MAPSHLDNVVIAGGSIAAVTTADTLRLNGFSGDITILSDEADAPYSRVPLSKGILAGREPVGSSALPPLAEDIVIRQGARVSAVDTARQRVVLADGDQCDYGRLVIATGARARRLAGPGQTGEHVVRDLSDAHAIASIARTASTAVVIGGGFLGMEVASTLTELGLSVTVIDQRPPLQRVLGDWLSAFVTETARGRGVRIVLAPEGVKLYGHPEVVGVHANGSLHEADLVISAVGDVPNVECLSGSGIPVDGGVITDGRGRVAPNVFAAGDVTATVTDVGLRRTPHWAPAVRQARVVAGSILHGEAAEIPPGDSYYWTEQFGLDIKISGEIPPHGDPRVLDGDPAAKVALLQWSDPTGVVAAVSVNYRMPIVKLKRLIHAM